MYYNKRNFNKTGGSPTRIGQGNQYNIQDNTQKYYDNRDLYHTSAQPNAHLMSMGYGNAQATVAEQHNMALYEVARFKMQYDIDNAYWCTAIFLFFFGLGIFALTV